MESGYRCLVSRYEDNKYVQPEKCKLTSIQIALLRKQYEDLYMSLRLFFARASRRREVHDFHKLPVLGPNSALTQVLSSSSETVQIESADGSVVLAAGDFEIFIASPQK